MRASTIPDRVDRIVAVVRHRSAAIRYEQCDQKVRWECRDSSRCSQCTAAATDLSCGETWSDWDAHSDWSDR